MTAGQTLGDFRLVEPLGQGGMGQVWKAEQLTLQRFVALKVMRPDRINTRTAGLFAREARAGARLHHSGIVDVHAYGESDGIAWIAMELVEGSWTVRDMLDDVAKRESLPSGYYREVGVFVAKVADALQSAHSAKVIHRDLKPQNILVTADNEPKVTDFGLARITDETALSATGDFLGTHLYMSPEQLAAKRFAVDHRADIFSLGVVLYEMLSLRRPFEGDTPQQVSYRILFEDPTDLRSLRSRIPHDLAVICAKCLQKSRTRRYATMAEVAADIRRHLSNEPIHARPPGVVRRLELRVRRHPFKSAVGVLGALALVAYSLLFAENLRAKRALAAEVASVKRLSSLQDYEDLIAQVDRLWPPHPEQIDAYRKWIADARELVAVLPLHHTKRDELRALAREDRAAAAGAIQRWEFPSTREGREARWWHANLTRAIDSLESLQDPETGLLSESASAAARGHGWSVPRRLRFARRMREEFGAEGGWRALWRHASAAIRAHPMYGGLVLPEQMGLVPIGRDPQSTLWEFWCVATGDPPRRGADGEIVLTETMGLVLVLIPGGKFWMGAQSTDASHHNFELQAKRNEGPVREIELSPYFLSKYEMTQAQWQHFTGENPSDFVPDVVVERLELHPVERVNWFDCQRELGRMGLCLPSEAQWERACRAGTETPWWTGATRQSLRDRDAVNLADRTAARMGFQWADIKDWPELDDGHLVHAAAGTFAPNGFGLHELYGNVREWCLDGYDATFYARMPAKDPVAPWEGAEDRVNRGGGFISSAGDARSANRLVVSPSTTADFVGVRPARQISN